MVMSLKAKGLSLKTLGEAVKETNSKRQYIIYLPALLPKGGRSC